MINIKYLEIKQCESPLEWGSKNTDEQIYRRPKTGNIFYCFWELKVLKSPYYWNLTDESS